MLSNILSEAHGRAFSDRVNWRIGYLRKGLLEITEQQLGMIG